MGLDAVQKNAAAKIWKQRVQIEEARETGSQSSEQKAKQSGITVAITSPVIAAVQTAQQMSQAAGNTSSGRMQALAAASAAMAANTAANAVQAGQGTMINGQPNQITMGKDAAGNVISRDANAADKVGGIGVNISMGSSSSNNKTTQTSNTAAGSNLVAGGSITIKAQGAGSDSDIVIQGSQLNAGNNVILRAEDAVTVQAATNTAEQHSTNKSSSASLGLGFMLGGTQTGATVQAGASQARGNADGSDATNSNSHTTAGNTIIIESGGDTTLRGAVVQGEKVTADVGGDLYMESLQDTSTFESQQKSVGFSVSACLPPLCAGAPSTGSISASKSNIDSNYQSVTKQTAIKTRNGGFEVNVKGNTTLKGAVIASTQAAIDNKQNSFETGGTLTTVDLENKADYSAEGVSVNIGTATSATGALVPTSSGAGVGEDSGSDSSITKAGISGIAGNTEVRSNDAETGIAKIFDAERVQKEIDAQVAITQKFNELTPKAAADYAKSQVVSLKKQAENETDPEKQVALLDEAKKWTPNGTYNIAMNIIIGAAGGNAGSSITKEMLSWAANEMRQNMIEDSMKFKGLCDTQGNCVSNQSGESVGVNGDEFKLAGGRIILQNWCADGRCEQAPADAPTKSGYKENADGTVIFNPGKDSQGNLLTITQFIDQNPEWRSPLGGHQGAEGQIDMFNIQFNYVKGSFFDKLTEAYAGTHDTLNSFIWYDNLGNGKNLNGTAIGHIGNTTNITNVLVATPFALSVLLPSELWNTISMAVKIK